jgi:hypothetical protein
MTTAPNPAPGASPPAFKIGLAMAGAVSAGAYTAGVIDFLLEALDAWYAAKAAGQSVPQHAVSLDVASGASAGAMCAALLAVALPHAFPHVRLRQDYQPELVGDDAPGSLPGHNPLYSAWVERIDIRRLLETGDLQSGPPSSLLDCSVLDQIVADSLCYSASPKPRPYVTRPFTARFTLGNLRGVPYSIGFLSNFAHGEEAMFEHADRLDFRIADPDRPAGQDGLLSGRSAQDCGKTSGGWQLLGNAALASGAFPLFLRPRLIARPAVDYDSRHCFVPDPAFPDQAKPIAPAWTPPGSRPKTYAFACVDGGVFNNEPFELAHEVIAGPDGRNPREGDKANAAVLMIAPFLSRSDNGRAPVQLADGRLKLSFVDQIEQLLGAWIRQCRFKPEELALAYSENVYSRFVIAPDKSNAPPKASDWIAGGGLSGFFGFFDESFRQHDYQLGRRNCQQFLRRHFAVPIDNLVLRPGYAPAGSAMSDDQWAAYCRTHWSQLWIAPSTEELQRDPSHGGYLPILPLVGRVQEEEEPLLPWPVDRLQPQPLKPLIAERAAIVLKLFLGEWIADLRPAWLRRPLAWLATPAIALAARWLAGRAVARIETELGNEGLSSTGPSAT